MNIDKIKNSFPFFNKHSGSDTCIYLDSAATTHKPQPVIDSIVQYYSQYSTNVHRALYPLASEVTNQFETVRADVAKFINSEKNNIVFTKSATEAVNLVAYSWAMKNIQENDSILVSAMEHHSNLIPWQVIAERKQANLIYIPINKKGELDIEQFNKLISQNVKLVAITHQSNVLGTINPIKQIIQIAKNHGALTLIDAAQSISHKDIDIKSLKCDFLVFSGHKMLGPTGVGVLYGKTELLENMDPFLYGGQMINHVELYGSTWNSIPAKFEAGTPNIAQVLGLGSAINYLSSIGCSSIDKYLIELTDLYFEELKSIEGMEIYGLSKNRGPIISFNIKGVHPYDLCQLMGEQNVCMRGGHHCAQPLLETLNIKSSNRISFHLYNSKNEIPIFMDKLKKTLKLLR